MFFQPVLPPAVKGDSLPKQLSVFPPLLSWTNLSDVPLLSATSMFPLSKLLPRIVNSTSVELLWMLADELPVNVFPAQSGARGSPIRMSRPLLWTCSPPASVLPQTWTLSSLFQASSSPLMVLLKTNIWLVRLPSTSPPTVVPVLMKIVSERLPSTSPPIWLLSDSKKAFLPTLTSSPTVELMIVQAPLSGTTRSSGIV